jgi:hypothetical protein
MLVIMESAVPNSPDAKPAHPPVMDVVPPKPADALKVPPKDDSAADEAAHPKSQKPAVTKPPKPSGSGVGWAIFATIVVVLGLAALMVYAYLRTNNISLLPAH